MTLRYLVATLVLAYMVATAPYEDTREPAMTCTLQMELPAGRWLFRGAYTNRRNETLDLYRVTGDGSLQLHTTFKGDLAQPIPYDRLDHLPYSRSVHLPSEATVVFVAKGWCPRISPYRLPTTGPYRDYDFIPPTEGNFQRGVLLLFGGLEQALINMQRGLVFILLAPRVALACLLGAILTLFYMGVSAQAASAAAAARVGLSARHAVA